MPDILSLWKMFATADKRDNDAAIEPVELNQLQDLLQNWINVWDKSMEITDIASVASTWSQRVLEMSGLLAS
ncbi:hypothetical protein [Nostoc sp.]|uniref:hypothetical protein n=1 Tax=Nostoc sp. TaxID=1180 RepID=UPI002FF686FE